MNLLELYCHVDDFYQQVAERFEASLMTDGKAQRQRTGMLTSRWKSRWSKDPIPRP